MIRNTLSGRISSQVTPTNPSINSRGVEFNFVSGEVIRALGRPRYGIRKALSGLRGRLLKLGQNREIRFRTRDILTDVANLVGGCRASRISDRSSRQNRPHVRMPSRTSEE